VELLQRLRRDVHEAVITVCGRQLAVEDQPVDLCAVHSEAVGDLGNPKGGCGIDVTVPPSQVRKVGQELLHDDASRFLDAGSARVGRVLHRRVQGDFRLIAAEADLVGDRPAEELAHAGPKMRAATFYAASDCIPLMTCW
jgi:hypothetical protein